MLLAATVWHSPVLQQVAAVKDQPCPTTPKKDQSCPTTPEKDELVKCLMATDQKRPQLNLTVTWQDVNRFERRKGQPGDGTNN